MRWGVSLDDAERAEDDAGDVLKVAHCWRAARQVDGLAPRAPRSSEQSALARPMPEAAR